MAMVHDPDYGLGPEPEPGHIDPVPVTGVVSLDRDILDKGIRTTPQAAAYGGWNTIIFTGTEQPVQILPFDDNRARALIIVSGTGPVYVGTMPQCQQKVGGQLVTGNAIEVRNQQQLFLGPDGSHSATVTVLTERWRP